MREVVFRERHEKVAFLEAITEIIGRVYNTDANKAFGHIVGTYAGEVFQETYDAELLKEKMVAIRRAQERIRRLRLTQERHLMRLDRMGEYYDRTMGPDLIPKPETTQPKTIQPIHPRKAPG